MNRTTIMLALLGGVGMLAGCGGGRERTDGRSPLYEEPRSAGEREQRAGELEERARLEPDEPYWPYRLAALQAEAGVYEEAVIACHDALEIDPDYVPALSLLAWIRYATGRYDDGIALLEEARLSSRELPGELGAALALLYDAAGDVERAENTAERYDRPGEHWRSAGSALVYVKLRSDRFDEAGRSARDALLADPGSAANQNNYGITLLYDGDAAGARDSFLAAVDLDPDLPGPYYNLAIVEKFYFFDDEAASGWFELYRDRSDDDPDDLAALFSTAEATRGAAAEKVNDR